MNMKLFQGIVVAGHQVASGQSLNSDYPDGSIKLQLPHFKQRGFDLSRYYLGTLNISIAPHTITAIDSQHRFEQVEWTDLHPPETFSFSACYLHFGGVAYAGWVYYPHSETKEAHFQDKSILEILTTKVPDINYGDRVELEIDLSEITLA